MRVCVCVLARRQAKSLNLLALPVQFTCFTSTKVQIVTQDSLTRSLRGLRLQQRCNSCYSCNRGSHKLGESTASLSFSSAPPSHPESHRVHIHIYSYIRRYVHISGPLLRRSMCVSSYYSMCVLILLLCHCIWSLRQRRHSVCVRFFLASRTSGSNRGLIARQ
jgi:hypothetical protein